MTKFDIGNQKMTKFDIKNQKMTKFDIKNQKMIVVRIMLKINHKELTVNNTVLVNYSMEYIC